MAMELYFYNECGFSQSVLNCMINLHCEDQIIKKNIRENPDFEQELITLCGGKAVPVLVIDGKPLKGSEEINQFLVGKSYSRSSNLGKKGGGRDSIPFFVAEKFPQAVV